ncbi:MAG: sensor histidine kinase [Ilumatobacter sp.]|jgi:signal transduction histidine kinase|uniref:sensor histidine kinase n=1 Tax=Ilumatobacter sp. TaxID=1967498 RepID=UPI00391982D0
MTAAPHALASATESSEAPPASSAASAAHVDAGAARGFLIAHLAMICGLVTIHLVIDGIGEWPAIPLAVATVAVCVFAARSERHGGEVSERMWVALAVIWIGLVVIDPLFLQAMFTLYPVTYAIVRWPQGIAASALMPVVWGTAVYSLDEPLWEWLLLPVGVWVLSCCLAYWILRVIDQSEERAALLAALEATRAELAEAQRAEGARFERDRMARDIHDTLAQGFSSIVLHARGALARGDVDSVRRSLELVEQVASEHLGEARRLVAAGPDESLGGRTLTEALQRVAAADEPVAHLHVDGPTQQLSGSIDVAVLRITQEAVANARKHARAERIDVTLAYTDREILLDVVDDGVGFDVGAPPRPVDGRIGGRGLDGIRARAAELGGSVTIESDRGSGTSISVALPTRAR